ncbi:uncharacterized protein BJX67DRAFT_63674 [Aspergillus lucknowensis]|uniref:DNA/RNA-binding domain-containing protein n=1 Tax=Aspergillus lucknowensis TaxID=176173 RepID=A0ABR4LUI2_9EURO
MSDGNASVGREPTALRRRESGSPHPVAEHITSSAMGSPEADLEGRSSPRRSRAAILSDDGSMNSNRAQHSASLSYTNVRASSAELPDDYASSAISDQAAEFTPSNYTQQGLRQQRKGPRPRSGTSHSRPINRVAIDNWTGKVSATGSESRLRYSVNSTDDPGGGDSSHSQLQQQQLLRPSSDSNDERFPSATSARQGEIDTLSRTPGDFAQHSSHVQKSVGRPHNDHRPTGGFFGVDGGTASSRILLQPETEPPTEEQLTNNVRGIYAGILMVEERCMEYIKIQSQSKKELSPQHWQQLIAVHRTLLQEHHDFLLATQNPVGDTILKGLAQKYSMPARLWRHGIQALLELLRRRLPGSSEYMLTFIHLAYSTMTLLLETAPAFEDSWIECLGDISRYRMLVEEADFREQEVWVRIARYWYNKAADRNPDVGRIQHHLAVLGRPDIVQQLFYYTKSLVCGRPFEGTRESILLILNPSLKIPRTIRRLPEIVTAFVVAHGHLFTGDLTDPFVGACDDFLSLLGQYIARMGPGFKVQGVFISSCNFAAIFEYGAPHALLMEGFRATTSQPKAIDDIYRSAHRYWTPVGNLKVVEADFLASRDSEPISSLIFYGSCFTFQILSVILSQIGNKNLFPNIFPSLHAYLAFLWCLARTPNSMKHVEAAVPWKQIAASLNAMIRNFTDFAVVEGAGFPSQGEDKWLPEDFFMRGQIWSQHLYPADFFINAPDADEGRNLEPASRDLSRMHRCLWLGVRLATFNRWITYDAASRKFSATDFASGLDELVQQHSPFYGKGLQKNATAEVEMHDT